MTNLNPSAFRTDLRAKLADGLTLQEAQSLRGGQPLSPALKKVVISELRPDHFNSPQERKAVLADLGIKLSDIEPEPSKVNELVDKLKDKLGDVAKDKLKDGYELDLIDTKIGDNAFIGFSVEGKIITKDDYIIQNDPNKVASTARIEEQSGKKAVWVQTGFNVTPRLKLGANGSVGPVTFGANWSAGVSISGSTLAPHALEKESLVEVAKDATIDLPFDSPNARKMEEGTDVIFSGEGRIAASASLGVGKQLASYGDLITVGASAGAGVSRSRVMKLNVRVKKLDGEKVFVSIAEAKTKSTSGHIGAHVGVNATFKDQVPDLGGSLLNKGGEAIAGAAEDQVEKYLKADLRLSHSKSEADRDLANYVIDLSTAGGRKAYEGLVRLDTNAADQLAEEFADAPEGLRPVRAAKLEEEVQTRETKLSGNVGPFEILRRVSRRSKTEAELKLPGGHKVEYEKGLHVKEKDGLISGLFAGARSVRREMIQTREDGGPWQYHFRGTYKVEDDDITTKADVARFLGLAKALGALEPDVEAKLRKNPEALEFDDSDRMVDVFVTHEGVDTALAKVDLQHTLAFDKAFATAHDLTHPVTYDADSKATEPWKLPPWMMMDHPKSDQVMDLLKGGPHGNHGGHNHGGQNPGPKYKQLTGRSLSNDYQAYKERPKFLKLMVDLKDAPPEERLQVFFDEAAIKDVSFERRLGTLAILAEPDNVLVNELHMRDPHDDTEVVFQREGVIQDPRVEINRRLKLGSNT